MNELPTLTDEQRASLPAGLEDVLMRTLDPDRIRRPEMADFARALVDPTVELPAPGGEAHTRRIVKASSPKLVQTAATVRDEAEVLPRRSWVPVVVALGGVAAIAIVIIAVGASRKSSPSIAPPEITAPTPKQEPASGFVLVDVKTTPPGAEVFVGTETAARGKTPLELRLARATGAIEIRITHKGFEAVRRSVDTLANGALDEILALSPRTSATPRPTIRKLPPDAGVAVVPGDAAVASPLDAARAIDAGLGTGLKDPNK